MGFGDIATRSLFPMTNFVNKEKRSSFGEGVRDFFIGKPQRFEQLNTLTPEQMQTQNQLMNAAQNKGAGGAFGESADYYRSLLSNESPDMEAFAAPEMRRFNERIMPDLAAQYAGMSAGDSGLTGSSFRNAAIGAGTDLSERLASMRAQLRQRGAEGLQNIGNQALNPYMQNYNVPAQQGLLQTAIPAAISGATSGLTGSWALNMFGGDKPASPMQSAPSGPAARHQAYSYNNEY